MSEDETTRRRLLRTAGVVGAASIAGCMGGGGEDETPEPTEPGSVTPLGYGSPTGSTETDSGENPTVRIVNLSPGTPELSVFVVEDQQRQGPGGGYGGGYGSPPGYGSPGGYGSPPGYGSPGGYGSPTPTDGYGGYSPPPGYGSPPGYGGGTERGTSTTDSPTPGIGGQTETSTPAGYGGYGSRTPTEFGTPTTTPSGTATGARGLGLGEHTPYVELSPGRYTLRIEAGGNTIFENPLRLGSKDYSIAIFGTETEDGATVSGRDGGGYGGGGYGGYGDYGGNTDSAAITPKLLTEDRSAVAEDSVRLTYVNGTPNADSVSIRTAGENPFPFIEHQERRTTELSPGRHTIRVHGDEGPLGVFDVEFEGGTAYTIFGAGYAPGRIGTPTPTGGGGYGGYGGYGGDGEETGTPDREDFRDDDERDENDEQDTIRPIRTPEGGFDTPTEDGYGGGYGGGEYGTPGGYGRTPTPEGGSPEERLFRPTVAIDVGDGGGMVTGNPRIRLANVSPTTRRMTLEVDGAGLKRGLRFRRLSDYTELPSSGTKHVIVTPPRTDDPLLDRRIYLGGGRFTVATLDGLGDSEGETVVRFHGAPQAPEQGRRATLGALHAVPDVENLAVSLAGRSDASIRRLPPGGYKSATIESGQHVVEIRRRGESGRGEILTSQTIDFDPQTAISLFASGYATPGTSLGSVELSVFTVLEEGQRRRNRLLSVTSGAFDYGTEIPTVHTCDGENQSPRLSVGSVPNGTESLAILVDDPDAGTQPFLHWTCWNIAPSVDTIPANRPTTETLEGPAGAVQGTNGAGEIGYTGPCPPEGDGTHRYRFIVFALDTTLDLEAGANREDFQSAIDGHVIQSALLTGTYER